MNICSYFTTCWIWNDDSTIPFNSYKIVIYIVNYRSKRQYEGFFIPIQDSFSFHIIISIFFTKQHTHITQLQVNISRLFIKNITLLFLNSWQWRIQLWNCRDIDVSFNAWHVQTGSYSEIPLIPLCIFEN